MAKKSKLGVHSQADTTSIDDLPRDVVVIPIVNSPIYPGMIAPIVLGQDRYTPELDRQLARNPYVALNLVKFKDTSDEDDKSGRESVDVEASIFDISIRDIYKVGVICKVVKKLRLPDGSMNILVHGIKRFRVKSYLQNAPLILAEVEAFDDILEASEELDAYTRSIINQVKKLSEINPYFNEEMKLAMINSPSPGALADLVAFALSLDVPEAQDFLETLVVHKRFAKLLVYLKREQDVADIQKKISDEVNDKVNKYQREYFLREQLKVIRAELGMDDDDKSKELEKLREGIEKADMSEDAYETVMKELERLESIPETSPEYNVTRTYINWFIDLPWSKTSEENNDIAVAKQQLEDDHYGLDEAKQRILEFLAVRKIQPEFDGTILCLSGPPGVGKTSLGKSIADSLGREFYRFSLGGMRDEAEIKGHRRTYIGAMPGKLVQALKRVKVNNPVIMLDEIDKLGQSYQGDPASSLLEVLDPEQNKTFIDNYLDVPYDLSKVLFIATANYIGQIPEALLDRMEVIEVTGYTMEEKVQIAAKWVIPKQLKKHGLKKSEFSLTSATLKAMIADYAREPGVRVMEQLVAKLCRKAAFEKVSKGKKFKKFSPLAKNLETYLGTKRFDSEKANKRTQPGVITGLAWTAYGGEILFVESIPLKGKGFRLTGQLGDVMNESATLAYSFVRKMLQDEMDEAAKLKAKSKKKTKSKTKSSSSKDVETRSATEAEDFLSEHEVHLHLPAGATPKDGPSAGITMALALYSLAMNKTVKPSIAMTGELSLTGKVLPVGGIKEKVLAAKRAGIKTVLLPKANEKDLRDVPDKHRKGMKFFPVATFEEVLKIALSK